jgi:hypothetical protein
VSLSLLGFSISSFPSVVDHVGLGPGAKCPQLPHPSGPHLPSGQWREWVKTWAIPTFPLCHAAQTIVNTTTATTPVSLPAPALHTSAAAARDVSSHHLLDHPVARTWHQQRRLQCPKRELSTCLQPGTCCSRRDSLASAGCSTATSDATAVTGTDGISPADYEPTHDSAGTAPGSSTGPAVATIPPGPSDTTADPAGSATAACPTGPATTTSSPTERQ